MIGQTKISSRGQIVLPQEFRKDFKEGTKVFVIQEGNNLILKKNTDIEAQILEDLEFERRTREAQERMDAGEYIEVKLEDLDEVLDSWRE